MEPQAGLDRTAVAGRVVTDHQRVRGPDAEQPAGFDEDPAPGLRHADLVREGICVDVAIEAGVAKHRTKVVRVIAHHSDLDAAIVQGA